MLYQVIIGFWEENQYKEKQIESEIPQTNLLDIDFDEALQVVYNNLGKWKWFDPDILHIWVD